MLRAATGEVGVPGIEKLCDVGQGFNFNRDSRVTHGHVTQLTIGETNIAADILVAKTLGGTRAMDGVFTVPVVAVLEQVSWDTSPTSKITIGARISVANAQLLQALPMPKKVVVRIALVVYDYDIVNNVFYSSFVTFKGTAPSTGTTQTTIVGSNEVPPVYGLINNSVEPGVRVGSLQMEPPGVVNYSLALTLAPIVAPSPQQLKLQTSATNKVIKAWGLPQA
jgi:hypothetical protein